MRKLLLLLPVLLMIPSCEWQPTTVTIPAETIFQTVNLVPGDTSVIDMERKISAISEISDPGIVAVELTSAGNIQLIAQSVGESVVSLSSMTADEQDKGEAYLKVVVTNGIYLQLYMGEEKVLPLSDYLTADQLSKVDSIQSTTTLQVIYNGNSETLAILSGLPGEVNLEIVALDNNGVQIAPLVFDTETIIRKRVLAELFTNAGCVNCPAANENLDHLFKNFPDDFSAIRYHVFWTDPNDPMNLYNPSEVEARRVYYGSSFEAPRLFMDGTLESDFSTYTTLSNVVEQKISGGTDIYLSYSDLDISNDSLFLDISIQNFSSTLGAVNCWTVLTEDSIYYVGTNGETIHNQAMRDMTSSKISSPGSDQILSHSLKLTPDFAVDEVYRLVTFIQDDQTKAIRQVFDRSIPEILGN